jgi:hypothetical protein
VVILLVAILSMAISGYSINGYCGYSINGYCDYYINGYYGYFINGSYGYFINGSYGYSIGGYLCLLIVIILLAIGGYYINGYW